MSEATALEASEQDKDESSQVEPEAVSSPTTDTADSVPEHEPEEGVDNATAEVARNDLELSNDNDESKETPGDDNQGGSCKQKSLEGAVSDQNRPLNLRRNLKVS